MTTSKPLWACDVCHEPVTKGGYLEFRYSEWHTHREASAGWTERHMDPSGFGPVWCVGDEDQPPGYVRWHVLHADCDPDPDRNDCYWIEAPRIATWRAVAGWSAHLHGKQWFAATDWGPLLYRAGVR